MRKRIKFSKKLIEQMAKSLIMAKCDLTLDYFENGEVK